MASVFISYRRQDSGYVASVLHEKLQARFGGEAVFLDIDTIPLGADFRPVIAEAVGRCALLIALIGDDWAGAREGGSSRRIDEPGDYVRLEIESALARDIPVIPVLTGSARMPQVHDLPDSLAPLAWRNAAELRAGRDLRAQLASLLDGVGRLLPPGAASDGAASAPSSDGVAVGCAAGPASTPAAGPVTVSWIDAQTVQAVLAPLNEAALRLGPGPHPPQYEEDLDAALIDFAHGVRRESVLLHYFCANLVPNGLILTPDRVYWRNAADSAQQLQLEQLRRVESEDGGSVWLFGRGARLRLNGREVNIDYAVGDRDRVAAALADLFRAVMARRAAA